MIFQLSGVPLSRRDLIGGTAGSISFLFAGCFATGGSGETSSPTPTVIETATQSEYDETKGTTTTTMSDPGSLTASPVKQPPSDVSPIKYPNENLRNRYMTEAVDGAGSLAEAGSWEDNVAVNVPPEDVDEVAEAIDKVPASPSIGGNFVKSNGYTIRMIFATLH